MPPLKKISRATNEIFYQIITTSSECKNETMNVQTPFLNCVRYVSIFVTTTKNAILNHDSFVPAT